MFYLCIYGGSIRNWDLRTKQAVKAYMLAILNCVERGVVVWDFKGEEIPLAN